MKFENLYKTIETIKKSMGIAGKIIGGILYVILSFIVLILEIGVGGIIGIFILLIILDAIFRDVWDIILIVGVIAVIGFIIFNKMKNSYQQKKEEFFKEETFKVVDNHFEQNKEQIETVDCDIKYDFENRTFQPEEKTKMLPLSQQEAFFAESYRKIYKIYEELENYYFPDYYFNTYQANFLHMVNQRFNLNINIEEYMRLGSVHSDFDKLVRNVLYELDTSLKIVQNGNEGEKRMKYALDLLKNQEDIIVLENVLLKYNNKTFETDFLVFSRYGVFSLEVKNIGSSGKFSIKITSDGQWLKVFNNGDYTPMQDVSSQLNYHVSLTEGLFKEYEKETGFTAPKVYPSIIIANNEVLIDNQAGLPISRTSKFATDLMSKEVKYNMSDMKKLADWIAAQQLEDKAYEVNDFSVSLSEIFEELKKLDKQINSIQKLSSDIQVELRSKEPKYLDFFVNHISTRT